MLDATAMPLSRRPYIVFGFFCTMRVLVAGSSGQKLSSYSAHPLPRQFFHAVGHDFCAGQKKGKKKEEKRKFTEGSRHQVNILVVLHL